MSNWDGCWVINVKNPLDCWLIDEDSTKPIYLENDFPKYDRSRMMQYRLCNHPSEEYQAKHPQKREMDGFEDDPEWLYKNDCVYEQMTLEEFLKEGNQ